MWVVKMRGKSKNMIYIHIIMEILLSGRLGAT